MVRREVGRHGTLGPAVGSLVLRVISGTLVVVFGVASERQGEDRQQQKPTKKSCVHFSSARLRVSSLQVFFLDAEQTA